MKGIPNFKERVIKAYIQKIISKEEAKDCIKRGFGEQEIPIFFDFPDKEETPLKNYVLGLEKMGIIELLIRLDGTF